MQADLALGQPVRLERHPGTVVGRLTASRAVRSGILWGLIFGVSIASSEISYTTIYKTQAERDALAAAYGSNKATSALFGPAPQLQTVAGFTVFKISMTLMILGAVWGLLLSTKLLRGEEDDGRWDLLAAGQTTRRGAAAQGLVGLGAGLFVLWAVTAVIAVLSGRSSSVAIAAGPTLYFALAMVATGCMFLAVGALTSQLAGTRRQAASFAAVFLGVAYAIRMIADAGVGLHWLIWVSPLGWVEQLQPLTAPRPAALVPILMFTLVVAAGAVLLAGARDVGAGILPDPAHAMPHLRLLSGPTGLAIRMMRATVLGWGVAIALSAFLYGLIAKSASATITGSSVKEVFNRLGATGNGAEAVLGVCFLIEAVLLAFVAAGQVTLARSEESEGQAGPHRGATGLTCVVAGRPPGRGRDRPPARRCRRRGLRLARCLERARRRELHEPARGRGEPRAPGDHDPRPGRPGLRRPASDDLGRGLRVPGVVAPVGDRGKHRRRRSLGARHVGLPPDGVRARGTAAVGGQRAS